MITQKMRLSNLGHVYQKYGVGQGGEICHSDDFVYSPLPCKNSSYGSWLKKKKERKKEIWPSKTVLLTVLMNNLKADANKERYIELSHKLKALNFVYHDLL